MSHSIWQIHFASDSSLRVDCMMEHESIDAIAAATRALLKLRAQLSNIEGLHPSYRSISIDFNPDGLDVKSLRERVHNALPQSDFATEAAPALHEIPVRYGGSEGPDLELVARHCGIAPQEVVRLHSEATYRVAFLGFSPGFPYLTGLPLKLVCPRRAEPRLKVPAGSVAIGGAQAGIYPESTPGGWNVIGKTQVLLFNPNSPQATLLFPGDQVRFVPLTAEVVK
jgi:KipI family sensor histidine kinase inhibitor